MPQPIACRRYATHQWLHTACKEWGTDIFLPSDASLTGCEIATHDEIGYLVAFHVIYACLMLSSGSRNDVNVYRHCELAKQSRNKGISGIPAFTGMTWADGTSAYPVFFVRRTRLLFVWRFWIAFQCKYSHRQLLGSRTYRRTQNLLRFQMPI